MANEQRLRLNLQAGVVDSNPWTTTSTVLASSAFASLPAIGATQHLAITINPSQLAVPGTNAEVVYVTAHTSAATTVTVVRAREGTTAAGVNSTAVWVHGPTVADHSPQIVDTAASLPVSNGLPFSGQMAYLLDTDKWQGYDGAAWWDILNTGAWTSFSPAVGGSGWAAGNSTVIGRYIKMGRFVAMRIYILWGSTTTFSASGLAIGGLPYTAEATSYYLATMDFYDNSAATHYHGHAVGTPGSNVFVPYSQAVFAAPGNVFSANVTATVPFTWAAGDTVVASLFFESTT